MDKRYLLRATHAYAKIGISSIFELVDQPPPEASGYQFESVEVKETAFRIDGGWKKERDRSSCDC